MTPVKGISTGRGTTTKKNKIVYLGEVPSLEKQEEDIQMSNNYTLLGYNNH